MNFGTFGKLLEFTVLDCNVPAILGMNFLPKCNPVIDWQRGLVTFRDDNKILACSSDDNDFTALGNCANVNARESR